MMEPKRKKEIRYAVEIRGSVASPLTVITELLDCIDDMEQLEMEVVKNKRRIEELNTAVDTARNAILNYGTCRYGHPILCPGNCAEDKAQSAPPDRKICHLGCIISRCPDPAFKRAIALIDVTKPPKSAD